MINRHTGWLAYLAAVFLAAWSLVKAPEPAAFAMPPADVHGAEQKPLIQSEFISGGLTTEVHSATAVELANDDIGVFWYAGRREGSSDVAIFSRILQKPRDDQANATWSEIRRVADRTESRDGLERHIRKLGNPLVFYHQNKLWLFYVTVSFGGWAASSINLIQSDDNGHSWSTPKRLITSPFLNISTLVKERALATQDGGILLPVYHEFIGKFSEILRIDSQGEVVDKYRISHGRTAIQPIVIPTGQDSAVAFLRNATEDAGSAILTSSSHDGGVSWRALSALELPNPNAAITSVSLDSPNEMLLVFNNDDEDRNDLTLAYAKNYATGQPVEWQIIHEFENANRRGPDAEAFHNLYSYPYLVKTNDGDFHLFYSWQRKYIKHVFFNRAALDEMRSSGNSRFSEKE